ncbi:MAG: hydantoinase/oxoprolinase family protein [Anaerolineae bacterium]|jgi:N-methylhydantoinase A/oxoprolinase/acetone carboxylase beta subunit
MTIALGIDTGGTYTDAALVDQATGRVLRSAKALTTRRDLSIGIGEAVDAVFRVQAGVPSGGSASSQTQDAWSPEDVDLVALSTTLATNAIVEGQGSRVCLILIGYDPELIRQYGFAADLATDDVVYVDGGHDIHGDEVAPLDEETLREAVVSRRDQVEAFAVSAYFSVRNPAHELRARALIEEWTGMPVTCGHELTTRLNSVRRATTVALNARLVPLLRELIDTLRRTLAARSIGAPLMVVKGDGSLVRAAWAMERPIETILSGPAASAVGAWHLAGREAPDETGLAVERDGPGDAVWAIDVGGTTTDIAALRGGRPRLSPEGAQVGRWRTMVEAVDVHTVGLGGDSIVRLDGDRRLVIGPQRVVPLSLAASQYPGIVDELYAQAQVPPRDDLAGLFLLARRPAGRRLDDEDRAILDRVARGPLSLLALVRDGRYGAVVLRRVERLVAERLVFRAGFTPTDALHALGRLDLWDRQAAKLGAQLLANLARREPDDFCLAVVEGVSRRAAVALVTKALSDEAHTPTWDEEPTAALLLERALDGDGESDVGLQMTLRRPVVAIGAPVEAYMPRVAEQLHTRLYIPPHAEVANAVGAVAGGVVQRRVVTITPLEAPGAGQPGVRVHLPEGVRDFHEVETAVAYAEDVVVPWIKALAREAGADHVEVQVLRRDQAVPVRAGWGDTLYLGTELTFTAAGRPSPAVDEGART